MRLFYNFLTNSIPMYGVLMIYWILYVAQQTAAFTRHHPGVVKISRKIDDKYKDYIVKVKTKDAIYTGIIILPQVIVTNANLPQNTIVCALVGDESCFKTRQIELGSQEMTFLETEVEFDMPEVFKDNTSLAECYEVGVRIEPSLIKITAEFVKCLQRECGELEAAVCDSQLAGMVTHLYALKTTLFVSVSFLQEVYKRRYEFRKPEAENSTALKPPREMAQVRSASFGIAVAPTMFLTVCFCVFSAKRALQRS